MTTSIKPMDEMFFHRELLGAQERVVPPCLPQGAISLDKNELPFDLDDKLKREVLQLVMQTEWNRYPSPFYPELEAAIGAYNNLSANEVVLGAGAASLIASLFTYFGLQRKHLIIARPSFMVFEFYCRTQGIAYGTWPLTSNFDYSTKTLAPLTDQSVVVLASPNNPTGGIIESGMLLDLMRQHTRTLFVVDEAYYEFAGQSCAHLLREHTNLVVLRSFSKAFAGAGARAGYVLAHSDIARHLKKLIMPFSLNHFAEAYLKVLLGNQQYMHECLAQVEQVIKEKDDLTKLINAASERTGIEALPSAANFLMLRFQSNKLLQHKDQRLKSKMIYALDLSKAPGLDKCMRLTIGTPEQNALVAKLLLQGARVKPNTTQIRM